MSAHPEGHGADVAKAVAIAALSALFTGLVTWGVEELKKRTGSDKKRGKR